MKNKLSKIISNCWQVAVIVFIIVLFIIINHDIDYERLKVFTPISDGTFCTYQIDSIIEDKGELVLNGWYFRLEKMYNVVQEVNHDVEFSVLLAEMDPLTGDYLYETSNSKSNTNTDIGGVDDEAENTLYGILADVEPVIRQDVNMYFDCEYDYSKSGFCAKVKIRDIDLNEGLYRVLFKEDISQQQAIESNIFIYRGELMYFNPIESWELNVENTDLVPIVSNGICIASCPEYHCSIYQYNGDLYWIVDEKFNFESDGNTIMEYMLGTTQFDKLPQNRIGNGLYWDDKQESFEANEVTSTMNCGRYRVSVRSLPIDYAITYLSLGQYDYDKEEWVWQRMVKPYYDFSDKVG